MTVQLRFALLPDLFVALGQSDCVLRRVVYLPQLACEKRKPEVHSPKPLLLNGFSNMYGFRHS